MVCTEDVCSWFRELYAPERIELVCSLLQLCLPLELRFIGSYVEDLARKDYYYLRDAENRANDPQELRKLTDIFDKETRAKMTTYLALIHSSNTVCSSTLYSTLTCVVLPALERSGLHHVDGDFVTEVLLSFTMAAYHPSFSFSHRHRLSCELHNVRKLFEDRSSSVSREHSPPCTDCSSSSSSCSSSSTDHRSGSKHIGVGPVPPHIYSPKAHNASHTGQRGTATIPVTNNGTSPNLGRPPVFVQNVEVKGCQIRPDRKSEFIIQVTWSDGHVVETCRTYQQLQQFHTELLKLFPKDAGAHKQERQIPFLPQDKGPSHNHTELEAHIKKYIRQISVMQDHIVQCDHVTTFFRSVPSYTPPTTSPTSTTHTPPMAGLGGSHGVVGLSSVSTSPLTIKVESSQRGGGHSPRMMPAFAGTTSPTSAYSCPPYQIHQGSPSSSGSSPLVSPSSSGGDPANTEVSPRQDIALWLKSIRLHKYTSKLTRFTFDEKEEEELALLSTKELERQGLTVGARKKLYSQIIKWKKPANGLVFDGPSPYHTSLHSYTTFPPPDLHQLAVRGGGNLSGVDSSSGGSECSSPPTSPGLERKPRRDSVSSSEEMDKDDPIIPEVSECVEESTGLLPTPHIMPVHVAGRGGDPDPMPLGMRPNGGVLGLPPGVREGPPGPFMLHHVPGGPQHMDIKTLPEGLHQYPPGVRPHIPGLFDNCCPPRGPHLRPVRGPHAIKTLPLPIHTTAATAPVMPSPKIPGTSGGVIFENGHQHHPQMAGTPSYTYVPNHSHGPHSHSGHPLPHGAVPLTHPLKINGQYTDGAPIPTAALTPSTETPTKGPPLGYMPHMNNVGLGNGGSVPSVSGGGPAILAWPSNLNTLASTSLTYSVSQLPPVHNVSIDSSNGKTVLQPVHSPQPPITSAALGGGEYPGIYRPAHSPAAVSSATIASSSSISNNLPPHATSTPPPSHVAASQSHHPAPPGTPNSTSSSCSSCGCHGNCTTVAAAPTPVTMPTVAPVTPTASPVLPPQHHPHPAYHMWYMHQAMWPNSHVPYLHSNTNGLINHSLPAAFPAAQLSHQNPHPVNGLSADVLYHPANLWINSHMAHNGAVPFGGGFQAHHTNVTNGDVGVGSINGGNNLSGKKPMCCNCGQGGHWATDCKVPTMDSMSHSGTYHLKLRPKSQDTE